MEPWADDFLEKAGALVQVLGDPTPPGGQYWALQFDFENRALRLSCNEDTDEIIVQPHDRKTRTLEDVSDDELFAPLIGKHVDYFWWMTNHRGYRDAFQMRLLDVADRSDATRQFEVVASAMYVWALGNQ